MSGSKVERRVPSTERTALIIIAVLLTCSSWFWAGADVRALPFIRWGAGLCGLLVFIRLSLSFSETKALFKAIASDPLFIPFALILIYLGCQWMNAWWPNDLKALAPNFFWLEGVTKFTFLPSTVFAHDGELTFWKAVYALGAGLLIRNAIQSQATIRRLYLFITINGLLLASIGLAFLLTGSENYYGYIPVERPFFGPFFYNNHAGQYLYLSAACTISLLLMRTKHRTRKPNHVYRFFLFSSLTLFGLAIFAIVSRMTLALWALLCLMGATLYVKSKFRHYSAEKKFYLGVAFTGLFVLGALLVHTTFLEPIDRKLTRAHKQGLTASKEISNTRAWQWETAVNIWEKHKVLGTGSGSYPYFCTLYTPDGYRSHLNQQHAGQVHNDFLQLLCQQGIIGLSLVAWVGIVLLKPFKQIKPWEKDTAFIPATACLLVVIHSMIDLPFSSIGVTTLFMALLTASAKSVQLKT